MASTNHEDDIDVLHADLQWYEGKITRLTTKRDALHQENDALLNQIEKQRIDVIKVQRKLERLHTEMQALLKSYNEALGQTQANEVQLKSWDDRIDDYSLQVNDLHQKLSQLESESD